MNISKFIMLLPTFCGILIFISCLFGMCVYMDKTQRKQGISKERKQELLKQRDLQEQEWGGLYK